MMGQQTWATAAASRWYCLCVCVCVREREREREKRNSTMSLFLSLSLSLSSPRMCQGLESRERTTDNKKNKPIRAFALGAPSSTPRKRAWMKHTPALPCPVSQLQASRILWQNLGDGLVLQSSNWLLEHIFFHYRCYRSDLVVEMCTCLSLSRMNPRGIL